jgi:7-cyano-7-deazaguanine synthase
MNSSTDVLVLLSGGVDSAACVAFFQKQGNTVSGMFVNYGQVAAEKERTAALRISEYYNIEFRQIRCEGVSHKFDGYVPGRNAFFVFLAFTQVPFVSGLLSLGLHAGTDYWDCSAGFAEIAQAMLNGYSDGRVRLSFPFLDWNKREIWRFCQENEVPLNLTYSCELGAKQPCGRCSSCSDLEVLRAL